MQAEIWIIYKIAVITYIRATKSFNYPFKLKNLYIILIYS